MTPRKVAIACQGGGSHAAFTWGVLAEILAAGQEREPAGPNGTGGPGFELIALSGTSAGALCALAAWYGLTPNRADSECGTPGKAAERLDFLWTVFAAGTPAEHAHNTIVQYYLRLKDAGLPLLEPNPYGGKAEAALTTLSLLGAREQYLGFPGLLSSLCPDFGSIDWPRAAQPGPRRPPRLVVGAVEVVSGNFEVFDSEQNLQELGLPSLAPGSAAGGPARWRTRRALSLEGVAASGTLPEVLPAQVIPDLLFQSCQPGQTVRRPGYYWDGLYSQNPPVRDLLHVRDRADKPDEIWVVRINPQEYRPQRPDIHPGDLRDRANALAGNLSLTQELDHILTVNAWLARHGDGHPPLSECKPVAVRTIKMTHATARRLGAASKFDRDPEHLAELRAEGQAVARDWLTAWRQQGASFPTYPDDARYPESV